MPRSKTVRATYQGESGDTVKIEMFDEAGGSIFGAIEQSVAPQGEAG